MKKILMLLLSIISMNLSAQMVWYDEEVGYSSVYASHREAEGIGYDQGYTTIGNFLAWTPGRYSLFYDLRAHIFNDGSGALNAGGGFRYCINKYMLGINGFYDLRELPKDSFKRGVVHRVGGGLEVITPSCFQFRANGYYPVGSTSKFNPETFSQFSENYALFSWDGLAVLPSVDAEFGYAHCLWSPCIEFYLGVRPYYLFEKQVDHREFGRSFGGKFLATFNFYNFVSLEGSVSYDHIYNTRVQGQVTFSVPFSFFGVDEYNCVSSPRLNSCCLPYNARPVRREEIIPIQNRNELFAAINPDTGSAFRFLFVDNNQLGTGEGTFEDPFGLLALAQANSSQRDVIYVLPGDGTDNKQDAGIVLKNYQKLVGSAASIELGDLTLPAFTPGVFPVISNTGGPIVELSDINQVAGLNMSSDDMGIINSGVNNGFYFIHDNFITTVDFAIELDLNQKSRACINDNTITTSGANSSVFVNLTEGSLLSMKRNLIENNVINQRAVLIFSNASNTVFEGNGINELFELRVANASTSASALRALGNFRSDLSVGDDTYLLNNLTANSSLLLVEVPNPSQGASSFENSNFGVLNIIDGATFVEIGSAIPTEK